jgi:hypothetical protein
MRLNIKPRKVDTHPPFIRHPPIKRQLIKPQTIKRRLIRPRLTNKAIILRLRRSLRTPMTNTHMSTGSRMPFMAVNKRPLSLITGWVGGFMTLPVIGTARRTVGATILIVATLAAVGIIRRRRVISGHAQVSHLGLTLAAVRLTPPFVPERSRSHEGNGPLNPRRHVQKYFTLRSRLFVRVVSHDRGVSRRADVLALRHAGKNSG